MTVKELIEKLKHFDGDKEATLLISECASFKVDNVYESIEGNVVLYSETEAENHAGNI